MQCKVNQFGVRELTCETKVSNSLVAFLDEMCINSSLFSILFYTCSRPNNLLSVL